MCTSRSCRRRPRHLSPISSLLARSRRCVDSCPFGRSAPVVLSSFAYLTYPELLSWGQVAGKLASGPACVALGARWVGLLTLVMSAACFGLATASDVMPFTWVFAISRFIQSFTWPCTSQVLSDWFDNSRHGECFGYMSTASRSGIIVTTALLYVCGADLASGTHFKVGTVAMLVCTVYFAVVFGPPPARSIMAEKDSDESNGSEPAQAKQSLGSALQLAVVNPLILTLVSEMMTSTPLAEFQSQVPLMLKSDASLPSELVSAGTMMWHVGVLFGVIFVGKRMDRTGFLGRLAMIGGPQAFAAAAFAVAAAYGTGVGSPFQGTRKMPLILALGAAVAPAQYLVVGTTVSRHIPPVGQATVLSLVDMCGYVGTLLLYRISDAIEVAGTNDAKAPVGVPPAFLWASSIFALTCLASISAVYLQELAGEQAARKRQ